MTAFMRRSGPKLRQLKRFQPHSRDRRRRPVPLLETMISTTVRDTVWACEYARQASGVGPFELGGDFWCWLLDDDLNQPNSLMTENARSIWFTKPEPNEINARNQGCANEHVGLEITEVGSDYLVGRMKVDQRTIQPAGVLHGGMSVVLAETLASWGAAYTVDPSQRHCVGQEINANHVRAASSGWVIGTARPLHRGGMSQVWDVTLRDEEDRLICISRVTMAVLRKPSQYQRLQE